MNLGLTNKIALVTASSQGLGKSVALELAKEGAHLAICGRNLQQLIKAKKEIDKVGEGDIIALNGDLSSTIDRERMISEVIQHYKKVDILVTNTGGPPAGKFEDFDQQDWDIGYELLLGSVVSLI